MAGLVAIIAYPAVPGLGAASLVSGAAQRLQVAHVVVAAACVRDPVVDVPSAAMLSSRREAVYYEAGGISAHIFRVGSRLVGGVVPHGLHLVGRERPAGDALIAGNLSGHDS